MDSNLITVEILINGVLFKPVLINTGYKCYSIMDKDFITELQYNNSGYKCCGKKEERKE